MKRIILPSVEVSPVVIILLDNFRFDQMYEMVSELTSTYKIEQMMYMSILPTATQYSRNSLFAGRLPSEMEGMIPGVLSDNQNELKLLWNLLNEEKYRVQSWYSKVKDLGTLSGLKPYGRRLEVYVVNFVDMILHLTANIESLKSLGEGESSIKRWARLVVEDGRFGRVINRFVERGYQVYITSDHGWTVGTEPMKVDGEDISKGFRYKYGVNMSVIGEKFVGVEKPVRWGLPDWGKFIFATENGFFVWGERADEYAEIYKRKMFHGGISLEEMVLSVIRIRG